MLAIVIVCGVLAIVAGGSVAAVGMIGWYQDPIIMVHSAVVTKRTSTVLNAAECTLTLAFLDEDGNKVAAGIVVSPGGCWGVQIRGELQDICHRRGHPTEASLGTACKASYLTSVVLLVLGWTICGFGAIVTAISGYVCAVTTMLPQRPSLPPPAATQMPMRARMDSDNFVLISVEGEPRGRSGART